MIGALMCSLAALSMSMVAGETDVRCVSQEYAQEVEMENALGWYNGDTDTAFVVEGQSFGYSREILWHELAHAWDLRKGTELNGYPSFFSETHTDFTVEEFARLQTLVLGVWPQEEAFPDSWYYEGRASESVAAMAEAGWLMAGEEALR